MPAILQPPLSKRSLAIASRAAQVAARFHHPYIDQAHFVVAFLEVPNEAIRAISKRRVAAVEALRSRTNVFLLSLPQVDAANRSTNPEPYTERMSITLRMAQHEAARRNDRYVSSRHLFLALATEDTMSEAERLSVSSRLLAPLELAPHQLRRILSLT